MRTVARLLSLVWILFAGGLVAAHAQTETPSPTPATAPSPAADVKIYGEYPLAYKEIITAWLSTVLTDPESAVVDWTGEPHPGELVRKEKRFVGYIVDFKVNARNVFGAPTGKQRYQVVIRDGNVVWGGRPR